MTLMTDREIMTLPDGSGCPDSGPLEGGAFIQAGKLRKKRLSDWGCRRKKRTN